LEEDRLILKNANPNDSILTNDSKIEDDELPRKGWIKKRASLDKSVVYLAPAFKITRQIQYDHVENWNDGGANYQNFDIMTRRYLDYCRITGN
jgi:hypothetical protein